VVDIQLEYDPRQFAARVPVLMVLEPERLSIIGPGHAEADIMFGKLIEKGLSARLRTAMLLTGHLSVELTMDPDAANRSLSYVDGNPVIPTLAAPARDIMAGISQLLSRIDQLPIEEIGSGLQQSVHDLQQSMHDLQHSMHDLRQLVGSQDLTVAMKQLRQGLEQLNRFAATLNSDTAPQLAEVLSEADRALVNIQSTMTAAEHFMGAEAPLAYELKQMILELSKAGRAVSALADYLERYPEALVFGKGAPTQ
jgi:paraquat-inducible protein B